MGLILSEGAAPSTPASGKGHIYLDTNGRVHILGDDGRDVVLDAHTGVNVLINGGFDFAQRQVPGTLTTYNSSTTRFSTIGADRWGMVNENASLQYQRVDTQGSAETDLAGRFYGKFKKITSAGKFIISQVLEANLMGHLRGQTVRFQCKMKYSVAASMTVRMGVLYLTSAGTTDTVPGGPAGTTFATAFGAAGTDPTWGTNLTAITPTLPIGGTVAGSGISCVLTSGWVTYSGCFAIPASAKNLVVVIYTNGQPAANDELNVAEASLSLGTGVHLWSPRPYGEEMRNCQRYFWKTFNIDQNPTTNVGAGTGEWRVPASVAAAAANIFWVPCPVNMFTAPHTVTAYNPAAANSVARNITDGADCGATTASVAQERGFMMSVTGSAGTAVGEILGVHLSAAAEI